MNKLHIFSSQTAQRVGFAILVLTKKLKLFIMMLCLLQLVNVKTAMAIVPTNYGIVFNVKDFHPTDMNLAVQRALQQIGDIVWNNTNNNTSDTLYITLFFPGNGEEYMIHNVK